MVQGVACQIGYFCPAGMYMGGYMDTCPVYILTLLLLLCPGTAYANANPCAGGTYGSNTSLTRQEECTVCPAGIFA